MMAPAPSPKRTEVSLSVQSMKRLSVSAPTTRACLTTPVRMNCSAMVSPVSAPEQAAETSKAKALTAPSAHWSRAAVEGVGESGE